MLWSCSYAGNGTGPDVRHPLKQTHEGLGVLQLWGLEVMLLVAALIALA